MGREWKEETLIKEFSQFLNENNLRRTPERNRIVEEIKNLGNHFDADELVFQIKQKGISVSRATVYRTLALLEESGCVRKFRFDENHFHYELRTRAASHAHLVCMCCGRIIEFDDAALDRIQKRICQENNYQPVRRNVEIYGVCPECQIISG